MKSYLFNSTVTMKPHNRSKYWIDGDIIPRATFGADSLREAVAAFQNHAEAHYITISAHALKNPAPMYIDGDDGDAVQVGYVFTGSTEFEAGRRWVKQYVEIWVRVQEVREIDFTEEV